MAPRIRTIKPEFWTDDRVGALSPRARLLFLCAFNLADDSGRLRWNDPYLRANAFVYDEISLEDSGNFRKELEDSGMVAPYVVRGTTYAEIVNFAKHQTISHKSVSKLPGPAQTDHTDGKTPESSGKIQRAPEISPRNREQGTGNRESPFGGHAHERAPAPAREDPSPADVALPAGRLPAHIEKHPAMVSPSISAADVVAAWVEATQSNGVSPTARSKGMVAKEAKSLLDSGNDPDRLLKAAVDAGIKGYPNLERELMAMSGRAVPRAVSSKPTRDDKVRWLLEKAREAEAAEKSQGGQP